MTTFEFYTSLTKRQLLKAFRQNVEYLNDVRQVRARGGKYYLGDNIIRVLSKSRTELMVCEGVLKLNHKLTANQLKEINTLYSSTLNK